MSSIVDPKKKKQQQISAEEEEEEGENNNTTQNFVTRHIQLKQPGNSGDTLDKDVVLRRIRHRRRVNRLKSTVKAFLGFASSSSYNNKDKHNNNNNKQMISWVDDAFAAP